MIFFTINSDFDRPERKGHGAKVPGSKMARERQGQGASWPGSESATESYWPIRSGERIGPGAKRLGTLTAYKIMSCISNTHLTYRTVFEKYRQVVRFSIVSSGLGLVLGLGLV